MKDEQRVLVAVDHSDNCQPAARAAARLCRELGAAVTLVYVVEPTSSTLLEIEDDRVHSSQVAWAEEQLDKLATEVFSDCDSTTRLVDSGRAAAESICDVATEVGASLIVMGTHGRSAIDHALFGSTATTVVRHATCDVLTVRPPVDQMTIRKIVCAIDFSEGSTVALKRASFLCRHFPAEVHAIHVVQVPFWPFQEAVGVVSAEVVSRANAAMKEQLAKTGHSEAHTYVAEGNAGRQIIKLADQIDADLILVGTRGLKGIKRWAIGSVAERVVRAARKPVWCARD